VERRESIRSGFSLIFDTDKVFRHWVFLSYRVPKFEGDNGTILRAITFVQSGRKSMVVVIGNIYNG
jgi:hypothetical protein